MTQYENKIKDLALEHILDKYKKQQAMTDELNTVTLSPKT